MDGVSVTVKPIVAVVPGGVGVGPGVSEDWPPHAVTKRRPVIANRAKAALRIVASKAESRLGKSVVYRVEDAL